MRLLIMGAGAMGSVIGGFMAKAGHDVCLAGRELHMSAIGKAGLAISGIWGEHAVHTLSVATSPQAFGDRPFDWVFITVKAFQTKEAVAQVAPLVGPETLVCSYQNGLGNAEAVAKVFGWERTVGARAIFGAEVTEPGKVRVTVIANPTALGTYDAAPPEERVREMASLMDAAGVPTVFTDRIATVLWAKVAYNCALNPLSALLDVPYGRLLDTEHTRGMMEDIIAEFYAVAQAMQVPLEPASAQEYISLLFDKLIPPTAAHYASMRADLRNGHRTEIDALNGAICQYGQQHGISTPVNAFLTTMVHAHEELDASS